MNLYLSPCSSNVIYQEISAHLLKFYITQNILLKLPFILFKIALGLTQTSNLKLFLSNDLITATNSSYNHIAITISQHFSSIKLSPMSYILAIWQSIILQRGLNHSTWLYMDFGKSSHDRIIHVINKMLDHDLCLYRVHMVVS